jgi:hypothetical protein
VFEVEERERKSKADLGDLIFGGRLLAPASSPTISQGPKLRSFPHASFEKKFNPVERISLSKFHILTMKRQINPSHTLRNVRRKAESADTALNKASDSSPSESALTSDTVPPDLESFTTHSQDSNENSESDEPSSEDTSSLASDDSSDEDDTEDAGSAEEEEEEEEEEDDEVPNGLRLNGITQYTDDSTGVTTLRRGTKPVMVAARLPGLLDKVRNFLPQLQAANKVLEEEKAAGTLSERVLEVAEDADTETYIEMVINRSC